LPSGEIRAKKVIFSLSHIVRPNTIPVDQSANFTQRTKLRTEVRKKEKNEIGKEEKSINLLYYKQ